MSETNHIAIGSYIRNTKHPYDGVCVVLDVREDRVKVFTERGEYAEIIAGYIVEARVEECITPAGAAKLTRALQDYLRRLSVKEYCLTMERANSAEQRGEWSEAADLYDRALTVEAESNEARAKRATCLRRSGRHEEALDEYRRLIADGSGAALVYLGQAMSLYAMDRLRESIESAQQAFAMDEHLACACELIAELHRTLADYHRQQADDYEQKRRNIINPDGRFSAAGENGQISLFE